MQSNIIFIFSLIIIGQVLASQNAPKTLANKILKFAQDNNFSEEVQLKLKQVSYGDQSQENATINIDQIANQLKNLSNSLVNEQKREDNNYQRKKAELEYQIKVLTDRINYLTEQIRIIREIKLPFQRKQLKIVLRQIKVEQRAIDLIKQKIENLYNLRIQDAKDFSIRYARQGQIYYAIYYLIQKVEELNVETLDQTTTFIQVKTLIQQTINSIPAESPFRSLIALTAVFDQKLVKEILQKLNDIKKSVYTSLIDDHDQEDIAKQKFQEITQEMKDSLKYYQNELQRLIKKRDQIIYTIKQLEIQLKTYIRLRQEAIIKRRQIQQLLENLIDNYKRRKFQRSQQKQQVDIVYENTQKSKSFIFESFSPNQFVQKTPILIQKGSTVQTTH